LYERKGKGKQGGEEKIKKKREEEVSKMKT
jgi:hypothetical protein